MNIFKRLFSRQNAYDDKLEVSRQSRIREDRSINSNANVQFVVHHAIGGYVLETRHYDTKLAVNKFNIYIINDDKDLGEEIGKILTLEFLRY